VGEWQQLLVSDELDDLIEFAKVAAALTDDLAPAVL
jgi:hypothetical protein